MRLVNLFGKITKGYEEAEMRASRFTKQGWVLVVHTIKTVISYVSLSQAVKDLDILMLDLNLLY